MKKYTNPITLLFWIILLSDCKQKNESNCDKNLSKLPQQAKDYFYFGYGSWWIYEEEATKIQDSVWLIGSRISSIDLDGRDLCPCSDQKCSEEIGVSLQTKKYLNTFPRKYFMEYYTPKKNNIVDDKTFIFKEYSDMNNKSGIYRFVWGQDGNLLNYNDFEGRIVDTINFKIGPFTFAEGLSYSYPKGAPTWEWQSKSVYAKGVGLVSYTLNDSTTWNLVKYHVVK